MSVSLEFTQNHRHGVAKVGTHARDPFEGLPRNLVKFIQSRGVTDESVIAQICQAYFEVVGDQVPEDEYYDDQQPSDEDISGAEYDDPSDDDESNNSLDDGHMANFGIGRLAARARHTSSLNNHKAQRDAHRAKAENSRALANHHEKQSGVHHTILAAYHNWRAGSHESNESKSHAKVIKHSLALTDLHGKRAEQHAAHAKKAMENHALNTKLALESKVKAENATGLDRVLHHSKAAIHNSRAESSKAAEAKHTEKASSHANNVKALQAEHSNYKTASYNHAHAIIERRKGIEANRDLAAHHHAHLLQNGASTNAVAAPSASAAHVATPHANVHHLDAPSTTALHAAAPHAAVHTSIAHPSPAHPLATHPLAAATHPPPQPHQTPPPLPPRIHQEAASQSVTTRRLSR